MCKQNLPPVLSFRLHVLQSVTGCHGCHKFLSRERETSCKFTFQFFLLWSYIQILLHFETYAYTQLEPSPLLKGVGGRTFQKLQKWGVAAFFIFFYYFTVQSYLQSFLYYFFFSFLSLYSTKILYHLYISDPFWQCTENADCFIKLIQNTQKTTLTTFFEYQGNMFLNVEKVLEKISEDEP